MNTTVSSTQHSSPLRALVLGGGGSTGNAWLLGVVAGLFEAGLDVTRPDLTVGTSAGSTAAAQLGGASVAELYAATLVAPPPRPGAPARGGVGDHLARMQALIASTSDAAELRRRIGAEALERDAASDGAWSAQWRSMVAARLPRQDWPAHRLLLTAMDAQTGEPVVFDRDSGVSLADAVAASCSSSVPHRIGERRYLDGGFRANADNADLAAGHERVLVLSPFAGETLLPLQWGTHLAAQIEVLSAQGSRVETVFPDDAQLFGANAMDLSLRPAAARLGHTQGLALAERLAAFWR